MVVDRVEVGAVGMVVAEVVDAAEDLVAAVVEEQAVEVAVVAVAEDEECLAPREMGLEVVMEAVAMDCTAHRPYIGSNCTWLTTV